MIYILLPYRKRPPYRTHGMMNRRSLPKVKKPCLKCRKPFMSIGNGNWLCDKCNHENSKIRVHEVCKQEGK